MIYQIRRDIQAMPENCQECKDLRKKIEISEDAVSVIYYCYVTNERVDSDRIIERIDSLDDDVWNPKDRPETCPLREKE